MQASRSRRLLPSHPIDESYADVPAQCADRLQGDKCDVQKSEFLQQYLLTTGTIFGPPVLHQVVQIYTQRLAIVPLKPGIETERSPSTSRDSTTSSSSLFLFLVFILPRCNFSMLSGIPSPNPSPILLPNPIALGHQTLQQHPRPRAKSRCDSSRPTARGRSLQNGGGYTGSVVCGGMSGDAPHTTGATYWMPGTTAWCQQRYISILRSA